MDLIRKHGEKIRFLIAGGWNTLFGYLIFALLFYLLSAKVHYMALLAVSYIFSITNAYLSYKYFVFKTKGNVMQEYFRFYVIYGIAFLANLVLLPAFVELLHVHPLISQALIIVLTVIISYFGHKNFSFGA
jgi:putative flippase GtrA